MRLKTTLDAGQPVAWRKMVREADPGTGNGECVLVEDARGRVVGRGFFNRKSEMAVRLLERGDGPELDEAWLRARLASCLDLRRGTLGLEALTDAYRVVNAEGDGMPGLVVDRYGPVVAVEVLALGWYRRAVELKDALHALLQPRAVVVRSDDDIEKAEGFRVLGGSAGAATEIREHGVKFLVDPALGHKTGFFLDQRDQRRLCAARAKGRRVLDLFCYSGGFALNALKGGAASVVAVDLDEAAIAQAKENATRNGVGAKLELRHADAFDALRAVKPGALDLVVVDPPKFARGAGELPAALRKYEDLNALAFEKVAKGGLVLTCSCSGLVSEFEFLRVLQRSALRAGREVTVLEVGGASPDHPWPLSWARTRYLKAVWCRVS